jgi:transcriptional regulator with XRE-family HTH domain
VSVSPATQAAFVKAVRHRLVDLGWNGKKLAHAAGISQASWSEILNGRKTPSLETIERICAAVGLAVTFVPVEGGAS